MKWFLRIWTLLFCGIPTVFVVLGFSQIFSQKAKIDTFLPVDAVVLSTRVETVTSTDSDGHTSTSYRPIVDYTYTVNDRQYQCDIVYPIGSISAGSSWANSVVQKFPKEKGVTAYHNPDQPDDAFLIRDLSYMPYMFTQFPMLFWFIGAMVWTFAGGGGGRIKPPQPGDGGGYRLKPKRSLAKRRITLMVMTLIWYGLGVFTTAHYMSFANNYETGLYVATPIYAGIGLIPAGMFIYYFMLSLTVAEPLVMTETDQFRIGEPFSVLIEQPIKTEVKINKLEVGVVCDLTTRSSGGGKTTYSTNTCYKDRKTLMENQQVFSGEPISGMESFEIPTNKSPSNTNGYPKHDWSVEVLVDIEDKPDYRGKFPIWVDGDVTGD